MESYYCKNLDIFVLFLLLFFKLGLQRSIEMHSCGGRMCFLRGHRGTFHLMECTWCDISQNVLLYSFKEGQLNCKDECNGSLSCKVACLPCTSAEGIYWQCREWNSAAGQRSRSICGLNQITGATLLCIPESTRVACPYIVPGEQIEVIHLNK